MALTSSVARRYAEAYFALGREAKDIPGWRQALAETTAALTAPGVAVALVNPKLALAERTKLGLDLLRGMPQPAMNLARLLIERRRTDLLPQILTHVDALADREAGVVRADVVTAVPVDRAAEREIAAALARRLGRSVETTVRTDPSIVGGLVIHIGDRVIDDSVRTHLQQLQAALA